MTARSGPECFDKTFNEPKPMSSTTTGMSIDDEGETRLGTVNPAEPVAAGAGKWRAFYNAIFGSGVHVDEERTAPRGKSWRVSHVVSKFPADLPQVQPGYMGIGVAQSRNALYQALPNHMQSAMSIGLRRSHRIYRLEQQIIDLERSDGGTDELMDDLEREMKDYCRASSYCSVCKAVNLAQ